MDPFGEFLKLARWPRKAEEIGRERLLALWHFASQQSEGFRTAVFGELRSLLGSAGAGEWEEKDWMEVAEALRCATAEERASLVEVVEGRLGSSRPELLERVLSAIEAQCGSGSESKRQEKLNAMTSGLNVTVAAEGAMVVPTKKRKLDQEADEDTEAEVEGPHKAILLDDTLDKILSFLDCKEQRTARLVCQKWNERVLANFHKKKHLELTLLVPGKYNENDVKILFSVDERMLSSIKMHSCDKRRFTRVFNYLRASRKLERLRVLTIWRMDEEALDAFIQVVNEGEFRGLEQLTLNVRFNSTRNNYKCLKTVAAGALPCLKYLGGAAYVEDEQEERFRTEHLPVALQSFVSASPKLENISSSVYLDLSGREVRTLLIESDSLLRDGEVVQMINSAKDSLVHLNLGECSATKVPFLPNLKTFACYGDSSPIPNPIDLTSVPGLKRLELPFNHLPKLLSPAKNLQEIQMKWIRGPKTDVLPTLVEPFNLLLNAGVDRLVLKFCWISIPQLLNLLELVNMEERVTEEKRKSSVLEFHYAPPLFVEDDDDDDEDDEEDEASEYDVDAFSSILEILGGNWGRVLLKDFRFATKAPDWNETELCLFAGRGKGVARISGEKGRTIYLKIKE